MKSIVILYECNSKYANEKAFDKVSGKELCESKVAELGIEIIKIGKCDTVCNLVSTMKNICDEKKADYAIFSYDDLPFFNVDLTKEMIKSHEEYKAEYTYADGYPYGFSPEIIDRGALGILTELSSSTQAIEGRKKVSRDSIYNLLKTEINSFEVEAIISNEDWRLYRLGFHCGKKENYISSQALYNKIKNEKALLSDPNEIAKIACNCCSVLKTVPGFYNIQICDYVSSNPIYTPYNKAYEEKNHLNPMKSNRVMSYENFSSLIDKIAQFSDTAVVSLSAWGEAFVHEHILKFIEKVLSYEGLSVYIETDGYNINDNMVAELAKIVNSAKERTNGWDKIMIAVSLDSVSKPKYQSIHKECNTDGFEKAVNAITKLYSVLPDSVYPQFVRMNENEDELESFFRYWNDKSNKSNGKFIIQKYDDFAGLLPKRKPADLSPILRNPCWHLRRDFNILTNGDVPFCRTYVLSNIIGNVFSEKLENIWAKLNKALDEHINKDYKDRCEKCDEYYTFNF